MPAPDAKRRILLHAGFHKTGTKTLQACLRANAKLLAPDWRVETRPDNDALRAVVEAARDFSISGHKEDLAMVGAQSVLWLSSLDLAPGQGLLVSSEDFAGHMPGRFGVLTYNAVAKILLTIVDMAGQYFEGAVGFEVLLTTRAREPWLRSLYYQQAKHPDLTVDFETFCQAIPKAADHKAIAAKLRRKLGEDVPVHLVALEYLTTRPLGPVEALFDLAKIPAATRALMQPIAPRNANPAPGLAEALVAANRLGLPQAKLKQTKDDLIKAAVSLGRKLG